MYTAFVRADVIPPVACVLPTLLAKSSMLLTGVSFIVSNDRIKKILFNKKNKSFTTVQYNRSTDQR